MTRRAAGMAACLAGFVVLGGCGKKGPPLPPLRPQPARITDITARAVDLAVDVSVLVPAANADGTTPSVIETVELYGLAAPAAPPAAAPAAVAVAQPAAPAAPPVTAAAIVQPANLIGTATVDQPAAPSAEDDPAPPVRALIAHDIRSLVDDLAAGEAPPTIRYVAIAIGRGRRSPPSAIVEVPLARRPDVPVGTGVTFDAALITVSWTAAAAGVATVVDEVDPMPAPPVRLRRTATPVAGTSFTLPVSFGDRRCFEVRHVVVAGRATVEGPAAGPTCVTPVDTFAPPAPGGLVAIAVEGAVVLSWSGVTAPDLAGYLVLRGEGANETLQPLTPSPVTERSYRDSTARPGVTYTYAVVAVDRAQPPNRSLESNRQILVAR